MDNEESHWIARILEGDREAFHLLVAKHSLMLRGFVGSQLYRQDEVDDLAQEVFITALERLEAFRQEEDFGAWLRGIARGKLQNHFRAVKRRNSALDRFHEEVAEIVNPELEGIAKEKSHDSIQALLRCIEKLPERMRTVVRAGLDNQKGDRLAREWKTTRSAIYNLQYRANKLLRDCVEKEFESE